MDVLIDGSTVDVSWYIGLFVLMLLVAILSKSLLANIGLVTVAVLGVVLAGDLYGVSDLVQYSFIGVFICAAGFGLFQMVGRVEHI